MHFAQVDAYNMSSEANFAWLLMRWPALNHQLYTPIYPLKKLLQFDMKVDKKKKLCNIYIYVFIYLDT